MAQDEMKRVNIRVSPEVHEWFKIRSDKTGIPMSSLMYLALEQYIQQQMVLPHIADMVSELKEK
jgi:predicted DNA binding CopG/RHH family protein